MRRWPWVLGAVVGATLLSCAGVVTAGWMFAAASNRASEGKAVSERQLPAYTNSLGMKFVLIPAGSFMMGNPSPGKQPRSEDEFEHKVTIREPFYLGVHKVTVGQFRRFAEETGYRTFNEQRNEGYEISVGMSMRKSGITWRTPGLPQDDDHPVVCINPNDANAFCRWLGKIEGNLYRLPYESEWEYACRAGTDTTYFWGNDWHDGAPFLNSFDKTTWDTVPRAVPKETYQPPWNDGFAYTSPVGAFRPNPWGLYDMLGDAYEVCEDTYGAYPGGSAKRGYPGCQVARGSGWLERADAGRAARRSQSNPNDVAGSMSGFRVVLEMVAPASKPVTTQQPIQ